MRPDWVHTWLEDTEADPQAVARLEEAMFTAVERAGLVHRLPKPARGAEARLASRMRARTRRRVPLWTPVGAAILVATAAALLAVLTGTQPEPLALSGPLASSAERIEVAPGVRVAALGEGHLDGTTAAPVIHWDGGELRLQVTPGVPLEVHTLEGVARVVGTEFTVRRDALGTGVSVDGGRVAVACADATRADLSPGAAHTCLPQGTSALLGRARALRGADSTLARQAVERALEGTVAGDPRRGEALSLHTELCYQAGLREAVAASAAAYLAEGYAIRDEDMRAYATWATGGDEATPATP